MVVGSVLRSLLGYIRVVCYLVTSGFGSLLSCCKNRGAIKQQGICINPSYYGVGYPWAGQIASGSGADANGLKAKFPPRYMDPARGDMIVGVWTWR